MGEGNTATSEESSTEEISPRKHKVFEETASRLPKSSVSIQSKSSIKKVSKPAEIIDIDSGNGEAHLYDYENKENVKENFNRQTTAKDKDRSKGRKKENTDSKNNGTFTSKLPTRINLTDTILHNGPNNPSVLVLKSLEPSLTNEEYRRLKKADATFRTGWLYDEIIDSFFWKICKEYDNVLLCPTLVTLAMAERRRSQFSIKHLWKDLDINSARIILAPWNPSRNHWVLVVIFLSSSEAIFLDPMSNNKITDDEMYLKCKEVFQFLVENKFDKQASLTWKAPDHTLQQDGSSCGVMISWYGHRLINGYDINSYVDTVHQRKYIFNKIVGKYLKDSNENSIYYDRNLCRECRKAGKIDWVECTSCCSGTISPVWA
eukprot:gene1718-1917_t